ncbi:hypothetical protein CRV00_11985 [Malaciobacter molluscorum]|uniref:relaxase/mobilization nuclease domain-containing protein n=1 Tax=Malaciobacter molluscorum TaxID=1032072 RepID=UPI00100C22F7|nr:relaxase/mobilization nuclease domain-containing protein [Malaciobacter molluscorum]RXJ92861.1 hypothetical protein CRV00_11985 [Malaciobacter molluscorum]
MIIDVSSSTLATGFKKYIFDGKDGNRDAAKVVKIEGDFDLAESMKINITRKKKSMNFVISLHEDDDVSDEKFIEIYNEIMDEMLVGMNREDVMICSAIHNDTDNKHIHVEVIDSHLVTNKPLELYMDRIAKDKERFFKIRDYIELKHNLRKTLNRNDHKPIPEYKESHFKKWIDEEKLKDFDINNVSSNLKTKKGRKEFQEDLMKYLVKALSEVDSDGEFKIKSLKELEDFINTLTLAGKNNTKVHLEVTKMGYNRNTDYDYFTITPEFGKPIRIESDIFGTEIFNLDREDRLMILQDNLRPKPKEISKINDVRNELDELNYHRAEYTFKRLGKHSDPKALYPNLTEEDLFIYENKIDGLDDGKTKLEDVSSELHNEQIAALGKFNLLAPDLLDPLIVKEKSKNKIKFKSFSKDKLDVEDGVYIVDTKEDSALKEANILNRIKERLLNDRKINEFVRAREKLESRIDKTIGDIRGRLSKITEGIRGIRETIKTKVIDSKQYVQEVFSESKKDDKVYKLTPETLKLEFNKLFESKKFLDTLDNNVEAIIYPDLNLLNEDLAKLISVNDDEAVKIFDIKIEHFIDEMEIAGKKIYKVDALDGQYHFKDKNDDDWYIMDADKHQLLYNHKRGEVKTLYDFIRESQHSKVLETYSIIEKNSKLEKLIDFNEMGLWNFLLDNQITTFAQANQILMEYDKFVELRFIEEHHPTYDVLYFSINGIKHEVDQSSGFTTLILNNKDYIENGYDPKELEDMIDGFFRETNPIENKNKSKKHHK